MRFVVIFVTALPEVRKFCAAANASRSQELRTGIVERRSTALIVSRSLDHGSCDRAPTMPSSSVDVARDDAERSRGIVVKRSTSAMAEPMFMNVDEYFLTLETKLPEELRYGVLHV